MTLTLQSMRHSASSCPAVEVGHEPRAHHPNLDHRLPRPVHVVGCGMKHDPSQAHRHRRERRTRRQEDKVITAVVAAIGGGDLDQWQDEQQDEETRDGE